MGVTTPLPFRLALTFVLSVFAALAQCPKTDLNLDGLRLACKPGAGS